MAAHLAGTWDEQHGPAARPKAVLCTDDVPLPVRRRTPRRESFCVHGERHLWTIPASQGTQRLRAAWIRRLRDSFGELRPEGWDASDGSDPAEHRQLQKTARASGVDGRLALHAFDNRAELLQVDSVAVSEALRAGARLQEAGCG